MITYCTILFYDYIKFEKKKQPISWNYVKEAVRFHSIMLWLNKKKIIYRIYTIFQLFIYKILLIRIFLFQFNKLTFFSTKERFTIFQYYNNSKNFFFTI